MKRLMIVSALVASTAVMACRDDGAALVADASATTAARTGSCDRVPAMSICSEYTGGYLAQNEAVLSSGCSKLNGTFVATQRPNTAVLGRCALSTTEVRNFYASGGSAYDAPGAQKECEGPYRGKWTAFK